MVKLKNAQVFTALHALGELSAPSERLPIKTAIKVRTLHSDLTAKWAIVEEVRKALIEQYAERDEHAKTVAGTPQHGQETVKIAEAERAAFNAAWAELLDAEVEIAITLSLADFTDKDGNEKEVSPGTLISLGELFTA